MARSPRWNPAPKLSCATCPTAQTAEWCTLKPAGLQLIDAAKVTQRYATGEPVYHQGDPCKGIYCMESGMVGLRVTYPDGNSKMLRTLDAGQTFGSGDFFAGKGYRASAYCLKDAVICHVPADAVRRAIQESPECSLAFLAHGAEDLQAAQTAQVQIALYPVRFRLATMLVEYKDKYGVSADDGTIELQLPVTWQEVADLIGARPESVSRAIQTLVRDGVIESQGRKVKIADLDLLLDELESTAD